MQEKITCSRNSQIFINYFELIEHQKQSFFSQTCLVIQKWFPQMIIPRFSKMVSTNGNGFLLNDDGFPLQGNGFPLQGVSTNSKLAPRVTSRVTMRPLIAIEDP